MERIAGIYGNSNKDEYLRTRSVAHFGETLSITFSDGSVRSFTVPNVPSKLTLERIPKEFLRNVSASRPGGGAVNSRIAVDLISEEVGEIIEARLLDANRIDGLIETHVPGPIRYLDLRPCPANYVLGTRDDKWIFRSQIAEARSLDSRQHELIRWLLTSGTILINGAKDIEVVDYIVKSFDRRWCQLIFMLTPSLPATFLKRILPAATTIIAAWDELQPLIGECPVTIEGMVFAAARLRELTDAELHLTMGRYGVLSAGVGSWDPIHIRLHQGSDLDIDTQALVRDYPARLCGAGDAFAAGVLASVAFGHSLLTDGNQLPAHIQNALAGCASALRWIGVLSDFHNDYFAIRATSVATIM